MSSSNIINFNDSFDALADDNDDIEKQKQPLINKNEEENEASDSLSHSSSSSLYQMTRLEAFSFIATHILYSKRFQYYYVLVIILSAISIILSYTMKCAKLSVIVIEGIIVFLLIVEVIIRLFAMKKYFFYSIWNILDIIIIGICIFALTLTKSKCEKGDNVIDNSILIFRYIVQIIRLGLYIKKNQSSETGRARIKSVNFGHIKKRSNYDSFTNLPNKPYAYENSIVADTGIGSLSHSAQNFIFNSYSQGCYCYVEDGEGNASFIKTNNNNILKTDQINVDIEEEEPYINDDEGGIVDILDTENANTVINNNKNVSFRGLSQNDISINIHENDDDELLPPTIKGGYIKKPSSHSNLSVDRPIIAPILSESPHPEAPLSSTPINKEIFPTSLLSSSSNVNVNPSMAS